MRVIIIGGVAGGMSAATRLRRLDESAEIIVLEKSGHVSYANCGLPYYVGGVIAEEKDLLLQTPASLHARFRLDVRVSTEVLAINPGKKVVAIKNLITGETSEMDYDKLILSPGASPVVPPIPGITPSVIKLVNSPAGKFCLAYELKFANDSSIKSIGILLQSNNNWKIKSKIPKKMT